MILHTFVGACVLAAVSAPGGARLQAPAPWKRGWKKVFWIALAVAAPTIIFILLILLIIHRGPAR